MLGKRRQPSLSAKAAETHGLLEFCVVLPDIYMPRMRTQDQLLCANLLKAAGQEALKFDAVISRNDRNMPEAEKGAMHFSFMRFATLYQRANGHIIPKFHLMLHMICRVAGNGNPRFYSTYKDESLNGVIARIARSCHRRFWEFNVHRKFNFMMHVEASCEMH